MLGKKKVTVRNVPVYLRDHTTVGEARVVSNSSSRQVLIPLNPDEGAIVGKFLHGAELTGIGVDLASHPEEKEEDAGT